MSSPRRGEVWLLDLGLGGKVRPALVLNVPYADHERALLTMVPHTTNLRGTRFEVSVGARFLKEGAFDAQGLVSVPPVRLSRRLGALNAQELDQVERVVLAWLGLAGSGAPIH